jgi:hypothetical protein
VKVTLEMIEPQDELSTIITNARARSGQGALSRRLIQ